MSEAIKIFYSYSRKDLELRNRLDSQLQPLRLAGKIETRQAQLRQEAEELAVAEDASPQMINAILDQLRDQEATRRKMLEIVIDTNALSKT